MSTIEKVSAAADEAHARLADLRKIAAGSSDSPLAKVADMIADLTGRLDKLEESFTK
jgi:hypothetical protein